MEKETPSHEKGPCPDPFLSRSKGPGADEEKRQPQNLSARIQFMWLRSSEGTWPELMMSGDLDQLGGLKREAAETQPPLRSGIERPL